MESVPNRTNPFSRLCIGNGKRSLCLEQRAGEGIMGEMKLER